MSELLKDLNEEQIAIAKKTEGNTLVLAGAGTGKTRTLTYKVAYLIEQGLAKPYNILAVTFTNKAAREMKDRIGGLVNITNRREWWIGTFHGICVRILVRFGTEIGIPSSFSIADEREQKALIKQILENHQDASHLDVASVLQSISAAKNNLVPPSELMEEGNKYKVHPVIGRIYAEYQDRLHKMGALDFDDLIMRTIDLFNLVPKVKEIYQEQFKYVLVDESQDLNVAQYRLASVLAGKHKNLCLIGDADQGIYSWRGANIDIIKAFAAEESTQTMKLQTNYRCTKTIVEASNEVIKNNDGRLEKILVTDNPHGEKICYFTADTEVHEARFVADVIDYCTNRRNYNSYKDFCILYRTNGQAKLFEDELTRLFLPYQIVGGISFYDRKEVKDMLAYLKLLVNPRDVLAFQRIANEPKRGVGDTTVLKIIEFINGENLSVIDALDKLDGIKRMSGKSKEALVELKKTMLTFQEKLDKIPPARLIKDLATAVGYLDMLEQSGEKDRTLNVYELADMADKWYKEDGITMLDFVRQMCLFTDNDSISETDNVVKLMTVHTAKGLEFPIVFIVGMEENLFPHFLSITEGATDKDIEEERRLFYVSMTRARQRLYLTRAELRSHWGKSIKNPPSRFLKEIPKDLIRKT